MVSILSSHQLELLQCSFACRPVRCASEESQHGARAVPLSGRTLGNDLAAKRKAHQLSDRAPFTERNRRSRPAALRPPSR
jgi:hypothetical protein